MCAWPSASARTKNWGTELLLDSDQESQLDLLHTYFNDSLNASTGHGHTGGTADGPKILLTGGAGVQGTMPIANGGTGVATLADLMNLVYPVGSVYTNYSDSTNPGTLLGFGIWVAIADCMLIGKGSTFGTSGATGGATTVNLQHNHSGNTGSVVQGSAHSASPSTGVNIGDQERAQTAPIANDLSTTQSVMNPYTVVYIWRRTV